MRFEEMVRMRKTRKTALSFGYIGITRKKARETVEIQSPISLFWLIPALEPGTCTVR
jgi:hypothetical protein